MSIKLTIANVSDQGVKKKRSQPKIYLFSNYLGKG